MIDWREIADADTWELFARDFLAELGFVIEVGQGDYRALALDKNRCVDIAFSRRL
jgi:hypothetical protein